MKFLKVLAVFLAAGPALAQTPDLDAVLDKVGDYVTSYERTFVGVVAEETYRQEVRGGRGRTDARGFPVEAPGQRRDLKADLLLVRAPAGDRWIQFRDVFEVDGKPVRERAERLAKLFLTPSVSAQRQVEDLTTESARREERGGTLIRTSGNRAMPSRGRFMIDLASGRVLSSELIVDDNSLRAKIDVIYALEPAVEIFVPREMREQYALDDGTKIEGRATYANFRRYVVTVDQTLAPPKK